MQKKKKTSVGKMGWMNATTLRYWNERILKKLDIAHI